MMNRSNLILTTSPPSQPAKKLRVASLPHRQRPLYGRKRHCHTVKERDSETGLHYYGARYLDSRTSRWLSGDPAVADYIPSAPVDNGAKKRNQNLPGMGGVFNYVNLHVYHYAGNSPVKLVDPDGKITWIQHINRNRHQNGYAPANRERMDKLVAIGFFRNTGNTATHNLTPEQNTPSGRRTAIFPNGNNIDYRGEVGTIFQGMQFIYNSKGEIVLDSVNKGTFDFISPSVDFLGHNSIDRQPWIKWGNGYADRREDVIMKEETWAQADSILNAINKGGITTEQARKLIQDLFPLPPPVPQDLVGGTQ